MRILAIEKTEEDLNVLLDRIQDAFPESNCTGFTDPLMAIKDFMTSVSNIIYPQTASKGLEYECTVSGEADDLYIGDEMKLRQVLVNVLGNAVKFTQKGRISLDVSVTSRTPKGVTMRFVVNDTGCGIAEENLSAIFEAFEQVDSSTTSSFGGSGLGLAITKNLLGLMPPRI